MIFVIPETRLGLDVVETCSCDRGFLMLEMDVPSDVKPVMSSKVGET